MLYNDIHEKAISDEVYFTETAYGFDLNYDTGWQDADCYSDEAPAINDERYDYDLPF